MPRLASALLSLSHRTQFVDKLLDMLAALMGYRGCGKTTIGKRIADRLWAKFVDIDDLIIRQAGGMSIRDIFLQHGEPYYRDIETECLLRSRNHYQPLQQLLHRLNSLAHGCGVGAEVRQGQLMLFRGLHLASVSVSGPLLQVCERVNSVAVPVESLDAPGN